MPAAELNMTTHPPPPSLQLHSITKLAQEFNKKKEEKLGKNAMKNGCSMEFYFQDIYICCSSHHTGEKYRALHFKKRSGYGMRRVLREIDEEDQKTFPCRYSRT
ncbi:hypothetical protein AVEN_126595-1 [Araneus ventricosus]|uniref:Uncharacterized protein n=1 Tax=Araneus ventricosus TaxID=182803 RepID=A0A4Y2IX97_ARAVE|nr:hypothetical protein AVEN_126594-1 [Araneus ventricosus]GBM82437.1 hypothetical protein AVEN_126595-1 [Araneus ventricosus]